MGKVFGCLGAVVIGVVAAVVYAVYSVGMPKGVGEREVMFGSREDVESALGVRMPAMRFKSAEEYRGVTSVRLDYESEIGNDSLCREIGKVHRLTEGNRVNFLRDSVFCVAWVYSDHIAIDYGRSEADYPRRLLADTFGIAMPSGRAIGYEYVWQYAEKSAVYEFDEGQSESVFEGIDGRMTVKWMFPREDGMYGGVRFVWSE